MAQRRFKKGEIYHEDESDSVSEEEELEPKGKEKEKEREQEQFFARDYITLKNRQSRVKQDNDESLLEYYTNEKYREYLARLKPAKSVGGGQEYR
jgi:hypothetical protein